MSGVPQGWPLLFILCVNDIGTNVKSTIRLFANDCVIYNQVEERSDCMVLQNDIYTHPTSLDTRLAIKPEYQQMQGNGLHQQAQTNMF